MTKYVKGYKPSLETRKRMSEAKKRSPSPNQFKKGHKFHSGGEKGWFKRGNVPWNAKEKAIVQCEHCKENFEVIPSRKDTFRFCSHRCRGLYYSGKKSCHWQGGKSLEPYGLEFDKKLKGLVRKRDNYMCRECNYTQEELGYKIPIHHIDYDKRNNKLENLISLCRSCHTKTNFSRANWTNYFKNKQCV